MSDTIDLGGTTITTYNGTAWMPSGVAYVKACPQCGVFIYDGYVHSCGTSIQMSPDFDASLQFAQEVDPGVLEEIKARALTLQARPVHKDLDGATVQSLIADILLLVEALE